MFYACVSSKSHYFTLGLFPTSEKTSEDGNLKFSALQVFYSASKSYRRDSTSVTRFSTARTICAFLEVARNKGFLRTVLNNTEIFLRR